MDRSNTGIEPGIYNDVLYSPRISKFVDPVGFKLVFQQLDQVLAKLTESPEQTRNDPLFVATSLEFARICFVLGKGFNRLTNYLQEALVVSEKIGDQRSKAMINLHLGRLFYFAEQRKKAMEAFSEGKLLVDMLEDEDISSQASELIGLFYFIQGYFKKATTYFEQATQSFEFGEYGHSGPMWLSYCYAFLGHYNRAIGTADYYRRLARERGNKPLSTTLRSVLGIFLVRVKKPKEATFHLFGALKDADQEKNDIAEYFARGGLAFYHMMEGRLTESKEWMNGALLFGEKLGLIKQYASPFVLENIFEYHRHGIEPIPGFSFDEEAMRILQEPNIHLCAVALRLMAIDGMQKGEDSGTTRSKLQQSEKFLTLSGDPVQLAKTRIEMIRLHLKQGDQSRARNLAQIAWKGFSGYGDIFYPDDLRHLLIHRDELEPNNSQRETLLQRFTDMIEELVSSENLNELLTRTVKATNRFLGAERGGIFWFSNTKGKKPPELIAAHNLFESDVAEDIFRPSLDLIFKAFHKNKPLIKHIRTIETLTGSIQAMIAVPFEVEGQAKGILYHDNAYINGCFEHFSEDELTGMAKSLSKYVNHILKLTRRLEEKASSAYKRLGQTENLELIAQSSIMKKIIKQVDKVARTDSTVLLLGETGVGKEVMAKRLHNLSLRHNHPLVVVDPTTIPETLFESEFFGHEKGAFTGADRQKTGWIELANKGTLFIDEVGEIPLSMQVKLLRSLQEKTLVRVGGTQTIQSNFRLIAATNKDLRKEVKKGNFREDLFYRLNVIPIELPPLRKRGQDIISLAQTFIKKYGQKYKQPLDELTQAEKQMLLAYGWPGNIRELKNIIERAVLLAEGKQLELKLETKSNRFCFDTNFQDNLTLEEIQRRYIRYIIDESNGKIGGTGGAAEKLGMKRTSLYARMRTLGMK